MKRTNRYLVRFVSIYLCVLLPMLFASASVTRSTVSALRRMATEQLQSNVKKFSDMLNNMYTNYNASSVYLSLQPELTARKMCKNQQETSAGISLLNFANQFNSDTNDIFICYGTDVVYSGKGLSHISSLFGLTFQCTAESIRSAEKLIFSGENGVCCLWNSTSGGYLLMHYVTRARGEMGVESVNFVIPFSRLISYFVPLDDQREAQLALHFDDGDTVVFYRSGGEAFKVTNAAGLRPIADAITINEENAAFGIRIEAQYDAAAILAQVRRNKSINVAIIAVGMLLSMLLSFYFGFDRSKRVRQLEALAKGEKVLAARERADEFSSIQNLIYASLRETERIYASQQVYRDGFCRQFSRLLFAGGYKSRNALISNMKLCGVELLEQYYMLVGVRVAEQREEQCLAPVEALAGSALHCTVYIFDQPVLVFLRELPNEDEKQTLRQAYARQLKEALDGLPVQIGMSCVYSDIMLAHHAYTDVERIFEQFPAASGFVCRESLVEAPDLAVRLSDTELRRFTEAVERPDEAQAQKLLQQMLEKIRLSACSEGNRTFLRYSITQALLQAIQTEQERRELVARIVQMDVASTKSFEKDMQALVSQCCREPVNVSDFEKLLDYIRQNYQNPSFSAEMAASFAGVSTPYLSRMFKAKMGMTYIDFLTGLRMGRALELIQRTDMPIKEIVEQVGYIDVSGFRRKFKAVYGMSVSEYKNNMNRKEGQACIVPSVPENTGTTQKEN